MCRLVLVLVLVLVLALGAAERVSKTAKVAGPSAAPPKRQRLDAPAFAPTGEALLPWLTPAHSVPSSPY